MSSRRPRIIRRVALISALTVLAMATVFVQLAAADPGDIGQGPPVLRWIEVEDSRGLSAWSYELSLDRGGITDPKNFFWAALVDLCWSLYWGGVVLAIWFLDWVLSFDWVGLLASPLLTIGDALQGVIDQFGLVPTLLTISALAAALWMARGKWATGLWELAMALVIAALASGVLAQPLQLVAGPDGMIYTARDWGFELAGHLSGSTDSGQSPDSAAMRRQLTGQMVNTFVRQPAELINFGQVLDGGPCEPAYNDVLRSGPHGLEPNIREAVEQCNDSLGEYAANPSASMATGAFLFAPAAIVILLLAIAIAGSVLAAGANVLWQGLKAIVHLVLGLLPGEFRGSLLLTVSEAIMSLILLGFSTIFLSVFLMVVQALFADATGDAVARAFVITDIVLVLGLLTFLKTKRRIRTAARRLAGFMAQRPGGTSQVGPTRLPDQMDSGLRQTAATVAGVGLSTYFVARRIGKGRAAAARRGATANRPPTQPRPPAVRTAFSGSSQRPPNAGGDGPGDTTPPTGPPAPANGPPPTASSPTPGSAATPAATVGANSARSLPRRLAGGALKLGSSAALAYLTGGASSVLSAAATAAKARRVARIKSSGSRQLLVGRLSGSRPSADRRPRTGSKAQPRPRWAWGQGRPSAQRAEPPPKKTRAGRPPNSDPATTPARPARTPAGGKTPRPAAGRAAQRPPRATRRPDPRTGRRRP